MERLFGQVSQQPTEQTILLLLGAVNDALAELNIQLVKAISYQYQTVVLQAESPAARVIGLVQKKDIEQRSKEIYLRRGGRLEIRKITIRVGTNLR